MDNDDKRRAIAARIRALLAKTVANGCTEAEALAAAELAARLLAQYELTMDEVEMRASPLGGNEQEYADEDVGNRFWTVAAAIAHLTGARHWTTPSGVHPVGYTFFGLAHEVEIAAYLLDICSRAVRSERAAREGEWAFYRPAVRRNKRISFLDGMADSLSRRIRALKPKSPPGSGLVVLRGALIAEEMARRGIHIETSTRPGGRTLDEAYIEGRGAGEAVPLDPGIRAPDPVAGALTARKDD